VQEAAGSAEAPPRADTLPAPSRDAPPAALPQPPEGPLPLDRFLCFALYSANHAMHGVYKPLLKEIGLTYPQYLTMTVLWETNNVPVGTITSKLQLDTNTLTPLLKRLETMDLVTRTRNPKDERQVILKLTRKGRALQKKTAHFSACILKGAGVEANDLLDLQSRIMTLRDNLRRSGTENG
jgi:DNA-binding MarR family transcriptional regulator